MKNPIDYCRYFKGEENRPLHLEGNLALFWDYEQLWANNASERAENNYRVLEYKKDVLPLFNEDDGVPISLKALLYNRYTHWMGGYSLEDDVKAFRTWLKREYFAGTCKR